LGKSRHATPGSHTVVQDGDTLGSIRFRGSDGAGFEDAALIKAVVDGTPGADDMPTALTISTTADGAAAVTERIAIRADGRIQVPNGSAPLITLASAGHVDLAEVSTPAAPSANVARLFAVDFGGTTLIAYEDSAGVVRLLTPPGSVVGRAYTERTTVFTTTEVVPLDDTIPQSGEGAELFTLAITPKLATSRIRGRFQCEAAVDASGTTRIVAVFKDSDANALASAFHTGSGSNDGVHGKPLVLEFEHSPATTSEVTYKVRVGVSTSDTLTISGENSARLLGGTCKATFVLEEIAA
jgi:hypothetical protein